MPGWLRSEQVAGLDRKHRLISSEYASAERERIKALERENRELRQANKILRKASAYFAMAELDCRSRT